MATRKQRASAAEEAKRAVQKGSATLPIAPTAFNPSRRIVMCTVLEVHTDSYTVDVIDSDTNKELGVPWPALYRSPNNRGGAVEVPKRGQQFILAYTETGSALLATIPAVQTDSPDASHYVLHNTSPVGAADPALSSSSYRSFRGALPPDVREGDWVRVGDRGNLVAVLEEGTTVLKASELAKIVATQVGDLLTLVGRNMNVVTDFGTIDFQNNGGHVSMRLLGGSQQTTEASPLENKFTIDLALGHQGEIADFKITDQQGRPVYNTHVYPNGTVTQLSAGKSETMNGSLATVVNGGRTTVIELDSDETVTGSSKQTTFKRYSVKGLSGLDLGSGADTNISAATSMAITSGGPLTIAASGNATPTNAAVKTVISNGSWIVDIGRTPADVPSAQAGFLLRTGTGDIELSSLMGKLQLISNQVDGVHIGGPIPGLHPAVFEYLNNWLQVFGTILDSHVHMASGSGIPAVPIWNNPAHLPLLKLAQSSSVTIGG